MWRGLALDADEVLRADLIQQVMCQGVVDVPALEARYGIVFASYFASSLQRLMELETDELVAVTPARIEATLRGRMLVRLIAMCFDRYLEPQAEGDSAVRFSQVV